MKKIHAQEKKQFKNLLNQEGIDSVEKRFQVLEAFLVTESHMTVDELVSLLNKNGIILDSDFVKDTLKLMVQYGFAEQKRFDNQKTRYEHRHVGLHHDHMICTKCKKIIEFTDEHLELLQAQIANTYGFHMLLHKMEIYGVCSDCLKDHVRLIPLDIAKPGHKLVIKEHAGGSNVNMRLINMGLRIGDQVEVITNSGTGQIVIAIDYNRYVLGRGMARKIMVEQIKSANKSIKELKTSH
ncbi:MAG: transcriptional repressor [Deltaproteobacteria bacterium]|nr:transcriptional repressor [Deltaproteobacteria bacterium]MBW2218951.1 transcriptional repressor [Deltaproteobacteria bacterium]